MRVELFVSTNSNHMESLINDWIKDNEQAVEVIDIRTTMLSIETDLFFGSVLYKIKKIK